MLPSSRCQTYKSHVNFRKPSPLTINHHPRDYKITPTHPEHYDGQHLTRKQGLVCAVQHLTLPQPAFFPASSPPTPLMLPTQTVPIISPTIATTSSPPPVLLPSPTHTNFQHCLRGCYNVLRLCGGCNVKLMTEIKYLKGSSILLMQYQFRRLWMKCLK